jgi:hypothetical protein
LPAFIDILKGKTPAEASDVQQVIDALSARRNTPLAVTVNDPLSYSLTLRNTDAGSRSLILYAADGTTVLFSADASGVKISRDGTPATPPIVALGSGAAPTAAEGNHVHGQGGYSAQATTSLELLYANSWRNVSANYAVEPGVIFVFCTAGIIVTLPAADITNRPIYVSAISGSTTVASGGGAVIGGSVNTSTGAVVNGVVSQGDSIGYKSDGLSWRATV